jgi:hypothetical protein
MVFDRKKIHLNYINVQMSTPALRKGYAIREATIKETETARLTLIHAVLASRDLLDNMKDEGFERLGLYQNHKTVWDTHNNNSIV